jgi:hypothetical protein
MLWMIPVPYTLNAPHWFLFYPFYPKDVETQQARERKRLLKGPPDLLIA